MAQSHCLNYKRSHTSGTWWKLSPSSSTVQWNREWISGTDLCRHLRLTYTVTSRLSLFAFESWRTRESKGESEGKRERELSFRRWCSHQHQYDQAWSSWVLMSWMTFRRSDLPLQLQISPGRSADARTPLPPFTTVLQTLFVFQSNDSCRFVTNTTAIFLC